jgi:hypothetical protein
MGHQNDRSNISSLEERKKKEKRKKKKRNVAERSGTSRIGWMDSIA